jgi:hypothetical protein
MKNLSNNWLTEGLIDFEYKKYVLLAYLQEVQQHFDSQKLYPVLSDLIFHYQNLLVIKENKKLMREAFPERLTAAEFENLKLVYEKIVDDDQIMSEIEDIIAFSLPEITNYLNNGRDLYDFFESKIEFSPVGITPLYPDAGYLFVAESDSKMTRIYQYQCSIFQSTQERYRGIHLYYIEAQRRGLANSYENMKRELTQRFKSLPNPATYLVESKIDIPMDETLLPIAKRLLIKCISTTA